MTDDERLELIRNRVIHGDLDAEGLAWCAECQNRKAPAHFDLQAYCDAHAQASRGVSARDLRGHQRRDGGALRRTARWLLERRDRDVRRLALDLQAAGGGWNSDLEDELNRRPNVIRESVAGIMRGPGQPVLAPKELTR